MKMIIAIKYVFLIFLTTSLLCALEFQVHENNSKTLNAIRASGDMQYNDAEKLDHYLSKLPYKKHTAIYFDSQGGNLYGGMKLGKHIKDHRIKTVIDGYKICASACALAFLGGTDRDGNKWMSSTTASRLGFHAFSNADGTQYADIDKTQHIVADILRYGEYVNAPMEIFIKNFSTPSDKIYWFSTQEELNLGIKVWDIENERFVNIGYKETKIKYNSPPQQKASDFIRKYFSDLKQVPYSQTWNMLSSSMKHKVKSFDNYKKWWNNQVDKVVLQSVEETGSNTVKARLKYYLKNGKTTCSQDIFKLQIHEGKWFIYDQEYKNCID